MLARSICEKEYVSNLVNRLPKLFGIILNVLKSKLNDNRILTDCLARNFENIEKFRRVHMGHNTFVALLGSTIFYPADAVSCERSIEIAANTQGICFVRTSRPATAVIYKNDEVFEVSIIVVVIR